MFNGIKNSFKNTKDTTTKTTTTIWNMAKELPSLPWKKLPLMGWMYIILGTIFLLIIVFVLRGMLN